MSRSVFISYSRADLDAVRPLARALRRTGLRTWLDLDDLRPGERWKEAIVNALTAADAMVFCVSSLSLDSAWTSVELQRALALAIPVIPVAMEPLDLGALPEALRERQVCDMSRHPPRHAAVLTAREIAVVLLGAPGALALALAGAALGLPGAASAPLADDDRPARRLVLRLQAPPWPGPGWPRMRGHDGAALGGGPAGGAAPEGAESGDATGTVEVLDLAPPAQIRLADLADWAGHAREAVLGVGAAAEPGLAALVLGVLHQAFGARRVALAWCGPGAPPAALAAVAAVAGVHLLAA